MLGAEVANALGYQLDDSIVLAHGVARVSLVQHDDKPFRVVGVLQRTGTPVDRTLHISLEGMEALHVDWQNGMPARGAARIDAEQARQLDLQPQQITAFLLGLNSKIATFTLQREINQYRGEPLLAILPGVALQELWSLMGTAEKALFVVSLFVVLTGLIGMLTAILTSLNERRSAADHRGIRTGFGRNTAGSGIALSRHRCGPVAAAEPLRAVSAACLAKHL